MIITVKEYNSRQTGNNMKFQNADGSLKKVGFVVIDGDHAAYFKTRQLAEANQILDKSENGLPSWEACYNN